MTPTLAFLTLVFLLLFVASVESRKDPGIVEGIQGLLQLKAQINSENNPKTQEQLVEGSKHNCEEEPTLVKNTKVTIEKEVITEDFEPRPSVTAYINDEDTSSTLKKKSVKDFEPRPSVTSYNDELVGHHKGHKLTVEGEFEPRPSVTAYNNDNMDAMLKKRIEQDDGNSEFEPRPSVTAYNDEFEPRPSITKYND